MKALKVLLIIMITTCFKANCQTESTNNGYFYGRGSVGLMIGNLSSGSVQLSSGYRFRFGLETGIGLGLETFYDRYAPVYAEMRYHLGKKRTQPFIGVMGGALLLVNGYYNDQATGTFGVQLGMTHFFNKHIGLSSSVGYRYAALDPGYYYLHTYFAPEYYPVSNHRAEVRIGLILK